ncbi:MAG: Hpt protein [uncultured bacterium]|nr:MAG: Hpt protein [uncultured bacterium]
MNNQENSNYSEIFIKIEKLAFFDKNSMVDLTGDNKELMLELLKVYLCDTPSQIQHIENYLQKKQFENVSIKAHTLKGASAMVGAMQLKECAILLEKAADNEKMDDIVALFDYFKNKFSSYREYLLKTEVSASDLENFTYT